MTDSPREPTELYEIIQIAADDWHLDPDQLSDLSRMCREYAVNVHESRMAATPSPRERDDLISREAVLKTIDDALEVRKPRRARRDALNDDRAQNLDMVSRSGLSLAYGLLAALPPSQPPQPKRNLDDRVIGGLQDLIDGTSRPYSRAQPPQPEAFRVPTGFVDAKCRHGVLNCAECKRHVLESQPPQLTKEKLDELLDNCWGDMDAGTGMWAALMNFRNAILASLPSPVQGDGE